MAGLKSVLTELETGEFITLNDVELAVVSEYLAVADELHIQLQALRTDDSVGADIPGLVTNTDKENHYFCLSELYFFTNKLLDTAYDKVLLAIDELKNEVTANNDPDFDLGYGIEKIIDSYDSQTYCVCEAFSKASEYGLKAYSTSGAEDFLNALLYDNTNWIL